MRYARVQGVLEQEDAFVAKMGSRTEAVFKPDGEKQLFSPEVILVTQAIHNAGKDAHKVHKTEIVRIACQVFRIGRSEPLPPPPPPTNGATVEPPVPPPEPPPAAVVVATPVAAPAPKATKKQPPKPKAKQAAAPKPPEPPKPEEPKTKPPAPKPAPKAAAPKAAPKAAAPKAAAPKPAPKAAPKAAAAPKPTPAPKQAPVKAAPPAPSPAETETREAALAKAKELLNPERPTENPAAFNAYISIYSMILTALQLTEIYDNQPGKEKRYKTLDELAKEVNKFTAIKSAKEAQKA